MRLQATAAVQPFYQSRTNGEGMHDGQSAEIRLAQGERARVCIDGRQIYLGPYGSEESKIAYNREVDRWWLRQRGRQFANITVGEAVLLFDAHAREYYTKNGKPTREVGLFKIAFRPLAAKYASRPVVEFGPRDLKSCRQFYVDAGMVRNSANAHARRITRMFRWLVSEELCPPEVLTGLQAVAGLRKGRSKAKESKPVRPVLEADVNAVLPFLSRQVTDMARLQMLSGCRPGEVAQIRPCDMNRDGDVWEFRPESHKSEHHGRERLIFLILERRRFSGRGSMVAPRRRSVSVPPKRKPSAGRRCGRTARLPFNPRREADRRGHGSSPTATTLKPTAVRSGGPAWRPESSRGHRTVSAIVEGPIFAIDTAWRRHRRFWGTVK